MSDALTLSDIHARGVALEWHEAVAVVRAVVEVLVGNSENAGRLPELHQIQISASGGVDVIGGVIAHDHPIRRLGQLLQATVGQSEPPVQLRLLISQATAPIPAYASIRQYDEALAYFERPGRSVVLQALHARASLAAVLSRAETVPTLDAIAPLPTLHPPKNARMKAPKSILRAVRLVGIGAVVVLVCGAGVQYLRVAGILPGTSHRVSAMASHDLHVFGDAIVNGLSWVTEHVGLGRMVSGDASVVEHPQAAAASSSIAPKPERTKPVAVGAPRVDVAPRVLPPGTGARPTTTTDASVATASGAVETPAVGLSGQMAPFAAFDLETATDPIVPRRNALVEALALPGRPSEDDYATQDEPAIYSLRSEGVSSPVAVRPQLPRELPPNVKRSDLRLIELIISPFGTVESVKLVGAPRNVHDSMLLSAAKAWVFRPAQKDGMPVRYRKTVSVAPRS